MIRLTDLTASHFHTLINPILDFKYDEFLLTGGRGSCKSSFISLVEVYGIMEDYHLFGKLTNGMVIRKVANTLRPTVYNQIKWAIEKLGVSDKWKCTVNPLCCTYKPSGQQILFAGCDEPIKIKGAKFSVGHCKYIWFEEIRPCKIL